MMNKIKKASKVDTQPIKSKKSKMTKAKRKAYKPKIKSGRIIASKKAKFPKISVKVKEKGYYSKFISKRELEKHLVNGKYVFTRAQEKQYMHMLSRFNMTRYEYLKFYYGVRKANAKGRRLAKAGDALYSVKFSTKMNRIFDRYDYNVYMRAIENVLSRNYKAKKNREFRKRFIDNIYNILDERAAKNIEDLVNEMSTEDLYNFIEDNPDLEKVMYESNPEKFTSFDKEATSLIETRLRDYMNMDQEDMTLKYDISDESDLIK